MTNLKYFIMIIVVTVLAIWFSLASGSDPTMDYKSLKGSGMSPRDYDSLVKERQSEYANYIKNNQTSYIFR
tara:strand:+ start:12 stop:224 length:213 start_codon:yes stop_codon:yes gene_type:complete